jgi:hypothetical protein
VTAPPRSVLARNNKPARIVIAALVTLVVAGLIAAVLLLPRHHTSAAVTTTPAAGIVPSSPTPVSSAESFRPSAMAQLATSPTVQSSASAVDSETALNHDVTDGYLAFEQALYQQLSGTSAEVAPLMSVAVGQVLANSEDAVARLRGKGEVQRGEPTFTDVTVTSSSASSMAVVCALEDDSPTRIIDAKTGTLIASGFQSFTTRTTMVLESGLWKASIEASVSAC